MTGANVHTIGRHHLHPEAGHPRGPAGPAHEDTDRRVAALRRRSAWLSSQVPEVHPLLADAYRRRAAELRLGAWALSIRSGAVTVPSPDAA